MAKMFKIRVTPSRQLFPDLPYVDFFIRREAGYIWDDVTWSTLPGYTLENEGTVDVSALSDGKAAWFFGGSLPNGEGGRMDYVWLENLPSDWKFRPGQKGFATLTFGGYKMREHFRAGKASTTAYSEWEFVTCY